MICLLHSIRDRAKKEKSPRSVGASGIRFFVFNDFEKKILEKKFHWWFHWKQIKKNFHFWFHWKKIEKNFHCWFHWKKIEKFFHCWFHWKKFEKKFYCWFIEKKFCVILPHISRRKKKGQISRKFVVVEFLPPPHKIFRIMVGETLKKLSKSYRI